MDLVSFSKMLARAFTVALVAFLLINIFYLIVAYFQLDAPFRSLGWQYGAFTLNDELAGIPFNSARGLRLLVIFTVANVAVPLWRMRGKGAKTTRS